MNQLQSWALAHPSLQVLSFLGTQISTLIVNLSTQVLKWVQNWVRKLNSWALLWSIARIQSKVMNQIARRLTLREVCAILFLFTYRQRPCSRGGQSGWWPESPGQPRPLATSWPRSLSSGSRRGSGSWDPSPAETGQTTSQSNVYSPKENFTFLAVQFDLFQASRSIFDCAVRNKDSRFRNFIPFLKVKCI